MATVYMVKVPQELRSRADAAIRALDRARACFIEEQGYCDGSTAWGFIVAVFNRQMARDTFAFERALREQMDGYPHWLGISVYRNESVNTKRGTPEGEQHG